MLTLEVPEMFYSRERSMKTMEGFLYPQWGYVAKGLLQLEHPAITSSGLQAFWLSRPHMFFVNVGGYTDAGRRSKWSCKGGGLYIIRAEANPQIVCFWGTGGQVVTCYLVFTLMKYCPKTAFVFLVVCIQERGHMLPLPDTN